SAVPGDRPAGRRPVRSSAGSPRTAIAASTCHSPGRAYIAGERQGHRMNDNREPENGGNPWMKSLLVWGGIFLALLLVVSMFSGPREAAGTQIDYSDFRSRVAEGTVQEVKIAPNRITGTLKNGTAFSTVPVANDTNLTGLLEEHGVRYAGTEP